MTVVRTIGTGSGLNVTPNHADINSWVTYLVSQSPLTDNHVGRVLWASAANELVLSTQQTISGVTPGAYTITLEAGDANGNAGGSFRNHPTAASNPLCADPSKGACITVGFHGSAIQVLNDKVSIRNLQIRRTTNGGAVTFFGNSMVGGAIDNTIFECNENGVAAAQVISTNHSAQVFTNCLFLQRANLQATQNGIETWDSESFVNCTIACLTAPSGGSAWAHWNAVATSMKNCILYGFPTAFTENGSLATASYCATDAASGLPGTNHQYSMVGNIEFMNVTPATADLRLKSTSVKCRNMGTATGAPSTDIIGWARPQ